MPTGSDEQRPWNALMHGVLRAAAERQAWGERPDDLYDPTDLYEAVLTSYRAVVAVADGGTLERAGVRDAEEYHEACCEEGVGEYVEALLADYEKAVGAVPHPAALLEELFRACSDAMEVRCSLWLPSRASVASVCRDTLSGLRGPLPVAAELLAALEMAFCRTDDPWTVRGELFRVLNEIMNGDLLDAVLLQGLKTADPKKETFRVFLEAFRAPLETDPEGACSGLFDAYVNVLDLDLVHYPSELVKGLLGATKHAIREAADPISATEGMLRLLTARWRSPGPPMPSWMRVDEHGNPFGWPGGENNLSGQPPRPRPNPRGWP